MKTKAVRNQDMDHHEDKRPYSMEIIYVNEHGYIESTQDWSYFETEAEADKEIEKYNKIAPELEDKLKSHDWTYEYSDDNRSWKNGQAQKIAINKLIKQLPEAEAKELYNKYAPDMFKKK